MSRSTQIRRLVISNSPKASLGPQVVDALTSAANDEVSAARSALAGQGLVKLRRPQLGVVLDQIGACPERYMATLTTGFAVGLDQHRKALSDTLHRVNKALFGNPYTRHRRVSLGTYAVQETTINQGIHSHILIGIPEGARDAKAIRFAGRFEDLLTETWTLMCPGARSAGQDIRVVTDFAGAAGYIHKDVFSLATFDNVDVLNTTVPKI